jgi:hypothetical protein
VIESPDKFSTYWDFSLKFTRIRSLMKFIYSLLLLLPYLVFSQTNNLIKVVAGDDPLPSFPITERYRYKDFMDGLLFDSEGKPIPMLKMNLQIISGNLETISEKGDTIIVDNQEGQYKSILIRSDFFLHHKKEGYFHVLSKGEPVKLVSKLRWTIIRRDPIAGGGPSSSISSRFASTRPDPVTGHTIKYEYLVYAKVMTYFLMDAKGDTEFVSKSSFTNAFSDYKKEIRTFISQHQIDFDKELDLKKLHKFAISLSTNSK